jgi:prepilin-type N-terminal cleavage/methylation domain-containing protein
VHVPFGMHARGFTLLEVIIAVSILCVAVLTVAQLLATGVEGIALSRAQTLSAMLASARLEQLRALAFEFDSTGARITDLATDLSVRDQGPGGSGLASAGTDSLQTSTTGFVDYLNAHGRWVGTGASPPADAIFVRRWSIDAWRGSPDALVVQVLVRPVSQGITGTVRRGRAETRLTSLFVRTHR